MIRDQFENFLRDSFGNGVVVRELRLSDVEVEYMKANYPMASLRKTGEQESTDGRYWYEISFAIPSLGKVRSYSPSELTVLREEKERLQYELHDAKSELQQLKQELEKLKVEHSVE